MKKPGNIAQDFLPYMSVKIFSSLHEGANDTNITRFFEKESGRHHVWVLGLFPLSMGKADEIMRKIEEVFHARILIDPQKETTEEDFENVLKDLNESLPEMIGEKAEELLRTGALLLAYMKDDELLVSSYGQGEVYLMRNASLMEISEGLSPVNTEEEYFQNISSGDIQDGDKLLLSTYRMQRFITEKQLTSVLQDGVTEAKESIVSVIDPEESGNMMLMNIKTSLVLPFEPGEKQRPFSSNPLENYWNNLANPFRSALKQYARQIPAAKRDHMLLGGAGLIAILLVVIFFHLLSGQNVSEENLEYAEFINNVEQKFSTVDTRVLEDKVEEANLLLDQIESKAEEMLQKRIDVSKAEQILTIAQNKRENVNRVMRITNPEVMSNLAAINTGIELKGLIPFVNEIIAFDTGSLYRVLIAGANAEGLGSVSADDPLVLATPFESKDEVLLVTESGSVLEWKDGQIITADTADETWKNTVDIQTYSKYAYFLDPSERQIWKYERRDSGFTIPEGWVTVGQEFLENAISFVIDGSIFLLTDSGEIHKFYRGEKVGYDIRGIPDEDLSGDKIYTTDALSSLFVLDSDRKRVIILSKFENEAVYDRQIVLENIGAVIDFFATENKIYLLTSDTIYEVPLASDEI
jgi:hypothetical protein